MKTLLMMTLLSMPLYNASANDRHMKGMVCSKVDKAEFMKKMEDHQSRFLKKLNLTKDQETRIKQIRADNADRIFAQVQKVRGAHTEMIGAIEKDAPSAQIRERMMSLEKEKQALHAAKFDVKLAIRDLLTPEQRQKGIAKIKDKMQDMCD